MRERVIAGSLRVSEVGLGCNNFGWRIGRDASHAVIERALDLGVTLFDTADMYGGRGPSEEMLGEFLGSRRPDVVVATKFGLPMDDGPDWRGASRAYVMRAAEASLRRLRTDYIDLYQLHMPDPAVAIEETLRALDDLVRQGKVRHVGCCNLPAWQLADAQWTAKLAGLAPFRTYQSEYSLLARAPERELIPAMDAHGVSFLPYFPLAGGMLTGKYRHGARPSDARLSAGTGMAGQFMTDANATRVEALAALAEAEGFSLLELAFAWLLAKPLVGSVIAGATSPEQIAGNVAAAACRPDDDLLARADAITAPPA